MRTHFLIKKTYYQLGLPAFTMAVLVTVIVLWALAQKNDGLAQGSFYIHIDSVNQFAWTIVPVLVIILIKFFWAWWTSISDSYSRTSAWLVVQHLQDPQYAQIMYRQ